MATVRDAWIGLLETHKQLTRALDAELSRRHSVTLSEAEALGRLAAAPGQRLKISLLAADCGLSLSRTSRLVDALEHNGLAEKLPCSHDGRAVEAHLTQDGLTLARDVQATHLAEIQNRFADRITAEELETLAAVFARFAPRAGEACTVDQAA